MKPLLSILLICSIGFTQELTVDGNLNVTGNIQNQTIDSLLQVIQSLESQLIALQSNSGFETRIYELGTIDIPAYNTNYFPIDLNALTGYNLESPSVAIFKVNNFSVTTDQDVSPNTNININLGFYHQDHGGNDQNINMAGLTLYDNDQYIIENYKDIRYQHNPGYYYIKTEGTHYSGTVDLSITVTAQFQDSDVQLRKPGLQSKDKETVK